MSSNHEKFVFDVIETTALTSAHDQNQGKFENLMSFETQSILTSRDLDSSCSDSDDEKSPRKPKKELKTRRVRKMKENSKWTPKDVLKYWKFWPYYQIKNPYQKLSWGQWKRDSIYKVMAAYIGKTPKQCKSKDQNMKSKQFPLHKGKDILQIAILKLRQEKEKDDEMKGYLEEIESLSNRVSKHMIMLEIKMKMLKDEEDRLKSLMSLFKDREDDI